MKLVQWIECLISTEDTDGLVLQHKAFSSHSADYAPMRFPVLRVKSIDDLFDVKVG